MADLSTREQLAEALKPLLPPDWRILPYSRNVDRLSQTTVMLHAAEIRPAPSAPGGAVETDFTITVMDPQTDAERAQGSLDDDVIELTLALGSIHWLVFRNAEPTKVQEYLSWDINTTTITRKDA